MAMSLPIPSSPDNNSLHEDDNPISPTLNNTNVSPPPTTAIPASHTSPTPSSTTTAAAAAAAAAQLKRKPSRRANTAERRATHNAVERQRRETLNGRFLDLAALLPNLSQIRRPSKSSIVNSSIAHIHASRRHRVLAARELRSLKLEADHLRRELNEWRDRAAIPRVEEPLRSDGFSMVLSGELEVIAAVPGEDDEDGDVGGYGYMDDAEDDYGPVPPQHPHHQHQALAINTALGPSSAPPSALPIDDIDDPRLAMMKSAGNPFSVQQQQQQQQHHHHHQQQQQQQAAMHLAHILPRPAPGMISSPVFDGLYDHPHGHHPHIPHHSINGNHYPQAQGPHFLPQSGVDAEKMAAAFMFHQGQQQQQHMMQAQRSLFTPPASAHGLTGNAGPNASGNNASSNGNGSATRHSPSGSGSSARGSPSASSPVTSNGGFFAFNRGDDQPQQGDEVSHNTSSPSGMGERDEDGADGDGGRRNGRDRSASVARSTGSSGSVSRSGGSPSYEMMATNQHQHHLQQQQRHHHQQQQQDRRWREMEMLTNLNNPALSSLNGGLMTGMSGLGSIGGVGMNGLTGMGGVGGVPVSAGGGGSGGFGMIL